MIELERMRQHLEALGNRHRWLKYASLAVLVGAAWALRPLVDPSVPTGTPNIVELQVAGTRETVDSLLASADRATLASALAWDYLLIAVYGLLLPLCLVLFQPRGALSPSDRYAPVLPLVAALMDAVQNILVRLEIGHLSAPAPVVADWMPAVAASCSLLSWTLVVMGASRLVWLVIASVFASGQPGPAVGHAFRLPRSAPANRGRGAPIQNGIRRASQ